MTTATPTTERAPAKVNLTLHITGQRADGYHLLDSLVVFADVADTVSVTPARVTTLDISGPKAATVPSGPENLVWQAAQAVPEAGPVHIHLDKHLPPAAGLGGGSADAAATLRALCRATRAPLPDATRLLGLGADLPVCVASSPARMRGVGERLDPVPDVPKAWLVLVNPGVAMPTAAVFAALRSKSNPPMPPSLPRWTDAADLCLWAGRQRNDLETPAFAISDGIRPVLQALGAMPGCGLARMSGSGATCFGLFVNEGTARKAATELRWAHSGWWIAVGALLGADRRPAR